MGGDKPLPYKDDRRGGVYPRPQVSEFCKRLNLPGTVHYSLLVSSSSCHFAPLRARK